MKQEKLIIRRKRRQKYNSYKGEITPAVENVIDRDFHATKPNQKWLTDITEFSIKAGKVYLSPIFCRYSGNIATRYFRNNEEMLLSIKQRGVK